MKTALWLTLLASTGVAFAQPTKDSKPAPPKNDKPMPSAKELDGLNPWMKTWSCTATNDAGEKVTAKLTLKRELEKFWRSMKIVVTKTKTKPAFNGMAMFGNDHIANNWALHGWDDSGGEIRLKASNAAISGTAMTWEGEAFGGSAKPVPAKFTMTIADKKLKFIGEFGGKKSFDYDCK